MIWQEGAVVLSFIGSVAFLVGRFLPTKVTTKQSKKSCGGNCGCS